MKSTVIQEPSREPMLVSRTWVREIWSPDFAYDGIQSTGSPI
jgi:hypothetical protein